MSKTIPEFVAVQMTADMIDEANDLVQIGSLTYRPSEVLSECDPIAFREIMLDYMDSLGYEVV